MLKLSTELSSLKQFLRLPEFKPALEYIGGRVIQKMSPNRPHGSLQMHLGSRLLQFAQINQLGIIYSELRCTFWKNSYVPDLCFIARGRIPRDAKGELVSKIRLAPDLAIEILSPGQTVGEVSHKLRLAIKHGLRLGWLIHPRRRQVYIIRPHRKVEVLRVGDSLSGEDVIPGLLLSFSDMFCWLNVN